ncbi:MAG: hypothetical protein AAGH45_11935 [Pseudomonadota bacterium]
MTAKPRPARGSLHRRLALGGLAGAALILGTGALLLALVFERALERRFDQDLSIVVDNLIASIARMPDPLATEALDLRDERFARAFSGWYWQVIVFEGAAEQQTALSPSLFGESLIGQADGPPPRGWVYAKSEGPGGRPLAAARASRSRRRNLRSTSRLTAGSVMLEGSNSSSALVRCQ